MTTPTLEQAARELLSLVENLGTVTSKQWDTARVNLRAALAAESERVSVPSEFDGSITSCEFRGPRLVGPHGGLRGNLPNPTDADLTDPIFNAIWRVTKTWDVNVPEYYVGYCGMNGSHVMLILNEIRAMLAAAQETKK